MLRTAVSVRPPPAVSAATGGQQMSTSLSHAMRRRALSPICARQRSRASVHALRPAFVPSRTIFPWHREPKSDAKAVNNLDGLIVAVNYADGENLSLSNAALAAIKHFLASPEAADRLVRQIEASKKSLAHAGAVAVFTDVHEHSSESHSTSAIHIAVVNTAGRPPRAGSVAEAKIHVGGDGFGGQLSRDLVRRAAAAGARSLRDRGARSVGITVLHEDKKSGFSAADAHMAAAEGAHLGLYAFADLKNRSRVEAQEEKTGGVSGRSTDDDDNGDSASSAVQLHPVSFVGDLASVSDAESQAWARGHIVAECQGVARQMAVTPANLMTPRLLSEHAVDAVEHFSTDPSRVKVRVRDEAWIAKQRMGCFEAVTRGSVEPPRFLELRFDGSENSMASDDVSFDYLLVGKGVTFDSGGISIKPSAGMAAMKGDMGGAAAVISAFCGIVKLNPPGLRVAAVVPMCENMPSGTAIKPGDVVTSRKGLTVEIDNTDAEGRLILADALDYGCERYRPRRVIDVATLTGAIAVALGQHAAGAFVHGDSLWDDLQRTSNISGERLWRMPVYDEYLRMMSSDVADLCNAGARFAGSCTAAAFLREFVDLRTVEGWAHLDVAGVDFSDSISGYHPKGMTGIPTRTLIELICSTSSSLEK